MRSSSISGPLDHAPAFTAHGHQTFIIYGPHNQTFLAKWMFPVATSFQVHYIWMDRNIIAEVGEACWKYCHFLQLTQMTAEMWWGAICRLPPTHAVRRAQGEIIASPVIIVERLYSGRKSQAFYSALLGVVEVTLITLCFDVVRSQACLWPAVWTAPA